MFSDVYLYELAAVETNFEESANGFAERVGDMTGRLQRQNITLGGQSIQLNRAKQIAVDLHRQLEETRAKDTALEDQTRVLWEDLDTANKCSAELQQTVDQKTAELDNTEKSLTDLQTQLHMANTQVTMVQAQVEQITAERQQTEETFRKELNIAIKSSSKSQQIVEQRTNHTNTVLDLTWKLNVATTEVAKAQTHVNQLTKEGQQIIELGTAQLNQADKTIFDLKAQLKEATAQQCSATDTEQKLRTAVSDLTTANSAKCKQLEQVQCKMDVSPFTIDDIHNQLTPVSQELLGQEQEKVMVSPNARLSHFL